MNEQTDCANGCCRMIAKLAACSGILILLSACASVTLKDLRKDGVQMRLMRKGHYEDMGKCLLRWFDEKTPIGGAGRARNYPNEQLYQIIEPRGTGGIGLVFLVEIKQKRTDVVEINAYKSHEYFSRLGILKEISRGVDDCSIQIATVKSSTPQVPKSAEQSTPPIKTEPPAPRGLGMIAGIKCDVVDKASVRSPSAPLTEERIIMRPPTPLSASSQVTCSFSTLGTGGKKEAQITEVGTYKGLRYRIHYDGSGNIQGTADSKKELSALEDWGTYCKLDPISDSKYCSIWISSLHISTWRKGEYRISVGSKHYPRTDMVFRADKNALITAPESDTWFSPAQTRKILAQMAKAKVVHTRFRKWPRQSSSDHSFMPYKTQVAIEILDWMLANLKNP